MAQYQRLTKWLLLGLVFLGLLHVLLKQESARAAVSVGGALASTSAVLLNDTSFDLTGDFTLIAHIYITGFTSNNTLHDIFSKISFASDGSGFDFWYQDTTSAGNGFDLGMRINGNQSTHELSTTDIKQNVWFCVAAVYDAGVNQTIYYRRKDALTLSSSSKGSATSTIAVNNNVAQWGNRADGNAEAFLGRIDNVRVYNRNLSPDQINVLCNQPAGRNEFVGVLSALRLDYYLGSNTVYPDYLQTQNGTITSTLVGFADGPPL